jgi:hypothetical protein
MFASVSCRFRLRFSIQWFPMTCEPRENQIGLKSSRPRRRDGPARDSPRLPGGRAANMTKSPMGVSVTWIDTYPTKSSVPWRFAFGPFSTFSEPHDIQTRPPVSGSLRCFMSDPRSTSYRIAVGSRFSEFFIGSSGFAYPVPGSAASPIRMVQRVVSVIWFMKKSIDRHWIKSHACVMANPKFPMAMHCATWHFS